MPPSLYLRSLADLARIKFVDGVAEVDAPIELLDARMRPVFPALLSLSP